MRPSQLLDDRPHARLAPGGVAAHALPGREDRLPALRVSGSLRRGRDPRPDPGEDERHPEQERSRAAPGDHLVALAV